MAKVHFTITLAGRDDADHEPAYEERMALRKAYRDGWEKLKTMQFQPKYFQFEHKNDAARAKARKAAEAFAVDWEARSGLKFMVVEGFFL